MEKTFSIFVFEEETANNKEEKEERTREKEKEEKYNEREILLKYLHNCFKKKIWCGERSKMILFSRWRGKKDE